MGSKVEKSFSTLGLADGILDGVLSCLIEAEKKAKSSREIQTIDVSRRGLRQDIYVGKVMVIPPAIMDEPDKIPDPLLKGAVLKLFNGEEAAELVLHQLASNEFDKLTPKVILDYKDRVFRDDEGKLGCIVLFQPAWANVRDFHAFRFIKDQEKLKTLLRHLVFSAYYRPSLSSLFQTLSEDQVKLDAVNLEYTHLGLGPQLQSDLKSWPLLEKFEKQGGLKTAAFVKLSIDDFVEGYLEAALWTSELSSEDLTIEEFTDSALAKAKEDCETFIELAGDHLGDVDLNQAGHLFWINRNVHGEGHAGNPDHAFWDQTDLDSEDQAFLSNLADAFGECEVFEDEEGLHLEGGHRPAPLPEAGSGHILPKESSRIRFASYNLEKIAEESMTSDEQAVMAELEKVLNTKVSAVEDADFNPAMKDKQTGGARQGETEVGDVTKNADGLRARPDYGSKAKNLTSALVEKVLPGPLLEDATPEDSEAEDYSDPSRKAPKVAKSKLLEKAQAPKKDKSEAPKPPQKAEAPKAPAKPEPKAPKAEKPIVKEESAEPAPKTKSKAKSNILNGYSDMRDALKSTFSGDDRDNQSDHVEKKIDWKSEGSPKKVLDAKTSSIEKVAYDPVVMGLLTTLVTVGTFGLPALLSGIQNQWRKFRGTPEKGDEYLQTLKDARDPNQVNQIKKILSQFVKGVPADNDSLDEYVSRLNSGKTPLVYRAKSNYTTVEGTKLDAWVLTEAGKKVYENLDNLLGNISSAASRVEAQKRASSHKDKTAADENGRFSKEEVEAALRHRIGSILTFLRSSKKEESKVVGDEIVELIDRYKADPFVVFPHMTNLLRSVKNPNQEVQSTLKGLGELSLLCQIFKEDTPIDFAYGKSCLDKATKFLLVDNDFVLEEEWGSELVNDLKNGATEQNIKLLLDVAEDALLGVIQDESENISPAQRSEAERLRKDCLKALSEPPREPEAPAEPVNFSDEDKAWLKGIGIQGKKKQALTYMHPGQILEQFYPDLLNSISGYPMGLPASNYTPPALQRMDGQIMDDEADKVTVSDYSDEGMMHSHGQPGLIQTQDDASVPLKPSERSIRGPFYSDQFYRIHSDVPPALLTMKTRAASLKKTANDKQKAAIVGEFLKKLCGEIASSLLAAFMTTSRPLFTYSPAYSEIDLKSEQSYLPMNPLLNATGMSPYVAQLKSLFDSVNDGDLTEAINNAFAQGAVWHESETGRYLYEVFVRIEEVDTEHLVIKYKYLTGTKD